MATGRWEEAASELAASLQEITSVVPSVRQLTDRLIAFTYEPATDDAAPITLIVSEHEVIFSAGHGTQFELGPQGESSDEVLQLARSVARGRLTETIKRNRVKFVLELDNGTTVSGTSVSRDYRQVPDGVIDYGPY